MPSSGEASVAELQRAVLTALRQGAQLASVHKEGGTVMRFDGRDFVSQDYGDHERVRRFSSESEFLTHLWDHFAFANQRDAAPGALSALQGWRMIHARLEAAPAAAASAGGSVHAARRRRSPAVWALIAAVLAAAGGLGYLKFHDKAQALRPAVAPPALQQFVPPPPSR
jgi:hypothetical protein